MPAVDDCQQLLDSVEQESSRVHSSLRETVAWLARVQDSLASLDAVSCDRDRLMLQSRDCEVSSSSSSCCCCCSGSYCSSLCCITALCCVP